MGPSKCYLPSADGKLVVLSLIRVCLDVPLCRSFGSVLASRYSILRTIGTFMFQACYPVQLCSLPLFVGWNALPSLSPPCFALTANVFLPHFSYVLMQMADDVSGDLVESKKAVLAQRRCIILAIVGSTPSNNYSLARILQNGFLSKVKSWLDDILNGSVGELVFTIQSEELLSCPVHFLLFHQD